MKEGLAQPMRIAKEFCLGFLLSLTLSLFCGELFESLSLVDDASNDFVEVSQLTVSKRVEMARRVLNSERVNLASPKSIRNLVIMPSIGRVPSSTNNLLRLLSIQRK